ncbi:CNFNA protein, partial [Amia calva]|nr:CNFNA protein [Amia calva]
MCKTTSEFGECLCLPLLDPWFCMAVTCSVGMIPPIALSMRSTIRERYNIKGTICGDCCVVTCCNSCAWCQMARELKHHKQPLIISAPQAMPMGPSSGGYPQIQTQYGSPGPYNIMPQ